MTDMPMAREVLDWQLELSWSQSEHDFLTCYREDSFLITPTAVHRGLEAIRACYGQLRRDLPNARFTYKVVIVEQDVGFVEWSADSDTHQVVDGADSYIIQNGYIRAQTIHSTLIPKNGPRDIARAQRA